MYKIDIPIFIINLKQDSQKKMQMQIQLNKFRLKADFVEAVDGRNLGEEEKNRVYDHQKTIRSIGRGLTDGEIGCALSHQKIYKKIVEQKIPYVVIFEDDAILCKDFLKIVKLSVNKLDDFDILLLGYNAFEEDKQLPLTNWGSVNLGSGYVAKRLTTWGYGTYGYIISLKGAKKILYEDKTDRPADHYTGDIGEMDIYALYPRCVDVVCLKGTRLENEREKVVKTVPYYRILRHNIGKKIMKVLPYWCAKNLHRLRYRRWNR